MESFKKGFQVARRYFRYKKLSIDEIMPFIGKSSHDFWIEDHKKHLSVKCSGFRQKLWLSGTKCVCCGLEGSHVWIEAHGTLPPHFNLYAVSNGKEMLMTADHILPKAKGGTTDPENLQLLCEKCNRFKSDKIMSPSDLKAYIEDFYFQREMRNASRIIASSYLVSSVPRRQHLTQLQRQTVQFLAFDQHACKLTQHMACLQMCLPE